MRISLIQNLHLESTVVVLVALTCALQGGCHANIDLDERRFACADQSECRGGFECREVDDAPHRECVKVGEDPRLDADVDTGDARDTPDTDAAGDSDVLDADDAGEDEDSDTLDSDTVEAKDTDAVEDEDTDQIAPDSIECATDSDCPDGICCSSTCVGDSTCD